MLVGTAQHLLEDALVRRRNLYRMQPKHMRAQVWVSKLVTTQPGVPTRSESSIECAFTQVYHARMREDEDIGKPHDDRPVVVHEGYRRERTQRAIANSLRARAFGSEQCPRGSPGEEHPILIQT